MDAALSEFECPTANLKLTTVCEVYCQLQCSDRRFVKNILMLSWAELQSVFVAASDVFFSRCCENIKAASDLFFFIMISVAYIFFCGTTEAKFWYAVTGIFLFVSHPECTKVTAQNQNHLLQ